VEGVLGPGGALEKVLERYEHRPEQLEMARAVERALAERSYLLAEAGTGTGKTLAYLVPAVLSGRKVIVSTATKTLQEQIFFKDIPLLQGQVKLPFDAAYLKGRSNYLCLHRFEAFEAEPRWLGSGEEAFGPILHEWALRTETGDRAELDLPEGFLSWSALSTTSETCLGQKCPLYEVCHVTQARRRAEAADVVVVNHHLFFADLALRSGNKGEGVLPRYEAVIFDEAHALEDAATEFFGMQVSSYRVEELCADALKVLPPEDGRSGMISAVALKVRAAAEAFFRAVPGALGLLGEAVRLTPQALQPLSRKVEEVLEGLSALASITAGEEAPELQALCRRSAELAGELDFIQRAEESDHVYWAEARGRGVFLRAAPIDIARELRKRLYSAVDTVVFTSATLTAEGRFDFFARRMGLSPDEQGETVASVRKVQVTSPFDFPQQAALYVPGHLPEPNAPGFVEAVAEEVVQLTRVTEGRAFILFTSLRNMEQCHQLCRNRLPFQVLLQGERPKSALLEAFKREPSVLFASHSFWEGVDVPGEALSLVVIDKLPFASPTDPLVAARIQQLRERGEEPFGAYQLPEAAIALRQGFGRLIRTREDRGIVAILDQRLVTKRYGSAFFRSLPAARRFAGLPALAAWFGG